MRTKAVDDIGALAAETFDVAIVGCGPTGACLAHLLGMRGISVLLIDRSVGVLQIPRAVHIDGETMRVFQSIGLASAMLSIMRPGHGMHWVDRNGDTLLIRKGIEGLGPQGWHNDYYFHQPDLERVLREGIARHASVTLIEGVELQTCRAHDESVELSLRHLGNGEVVTVSCSYAVGCDGARSAVRAVLGDTHEDLGQHQAWLVVDGVLNHPLPLPEHSVQHCDPERPATSIYVHPLRRRWEVMVLPDDDLEAITRPDVVWQLLARWVAPVQATLERAATYMFHSLVSDHWQRGRLMIAGDAAHQTPPFLGQGLCAGVRDAANLGWKLALAIRSPSRAHAAALLATYEPERKPHAREFVQLAVEMGRIIQVTDPKEAELRDARLKAEGLQFFFPTPRLGPGVHIAARDAAGRIFPQPMLGNGEWLDDRVGGRFCLLLDDTAAAWIDAAAAAKLNAMDAVVVRDIGRDTQTWMLQRHVHAVLLRPDSYVFDVCTHSGELRVAIERLFDWAEPESAPLQKH